MAVISQLELPGSPVEQPSWAAQTWYWDPANEISSGETISSPTATVYEYDPAYAANVADYKDVTASVVSGGAPTIGTGTHANMVQITLLSGLQVGYEYRVELTCSGSLGSTPARYFRVRVRV